jgi:hypothetical protein
MKNKQDGSPLRPTMRPSAKTGPGYKPAQGAPKVTITPKAKTGGMVNSNAKVTASKAAKGKVGGISKAPKTAVPKAKYGMTMKSGDTKPKAMYGASMKPGMMRKGGSK